MATQLLGESAALLCVKISNVAFVATNPSWKRCITKGRTLDKFEDGPTHSQTDWRTGLPGDIIQMY
jgi:hypothetical protein